VIAALDVVGEMIDDKTIAFDHSKLDSRRVIVSDHGLAGARLGDIDLSGYHAVVPFAVGIAAGMLLGLVPFPLPGGGTLTLGFAGGPLITGLVLGAFGHTRPMCWQLPTPANQTVRQLGVALLLAGIAPRPDRHSRTPSPSRSRCG
jgi:putative transport protein